jgi:HEAT repeat protein
MSQAFDRKIAGIEALRSAPEDAALAGLRKALGDRNNYAVAKAAGVAGVRELKDLVPDLVSAFDRFMTNPAKSDPQCWAKNAIAKALKDLEYDEPEIFLRGLAHVQLEAVWGGRQDTAATLRGTCAHALVACRTDSFSVLIRLTGLLSDPETPVRIDAVRAIAQLSAREGVLPLRLKALTGDKEPEVTGHCFAALLSLAPRESLEFVAGFLHHADADVRMEAAGALALSYEPEAIEHLRRFFESQTDPFVKKTLLTLLGGSPVPAAADFLVSVLEDSSGPVAAEAVKALANSRFRAQVHGRVATIIAGRGDDELTSLLARAFDQA